MNAKWENDDWKTTHPDEEKIVCKDCVFREKDQQASPTVTIKGCTKGVCQVFPLSNPKPFGVLYRNESCPYHVSETVD